MHNATIWRCSVWFGCKVLTLLTCWSASGATREVVYSWPKAMQSDQRGHYPIALLQLALAKSDAAQAGLQFVIKPSDFVMTQERTLKQLELAQGIDVVWTMTNPQREQQLQPIRFPIDRGLIGWRLLAIAQQDAQRFAGLTEAAQLKKMLMVQGGDWPDYAILTANGFQVTPSNHFNGMYQMLSRGRVQMFPRSVTEIWPEIAERPQASVMVAPRWVLHYPAALYFFVRKGDHQLAQAISQGLEQALADGSLRQLFQQHFHQAIDQAQLTQRQVIHLQNPQLPAATPLQRPELWFQPEQGF